MVEYYIGIFHLLFTFIGSVYFFWRNEFSDIFFILYCCLLNFSWLFLKDECLISYFIKKFKYDDYALGKSSDVEDFDTVLGHDNSKHVLNYSLWMDLLNIIIIVLFGRMKFLLATMLGFFAITRFLYISTFRNMTFTTDQSEYIKDFHFLFTTALFSYVVYLLNNKIKIQD